MYSVRRDEDEGDLMPIFGQPGVEIEPLICGVLQRGPKQRGRR